jgi:hypothetical protein
MTLPATAREIPTGESAKAIHARRFPRRSICLLGRYTLGGATEYPCQTINISAGGAALFAPVQGRPGDSIILHVDRIGRLEGQILRVSRCGFVLEFASLLASARIQRFLDAHSINNL